MGRMQRIVLVINGNPKKKRGGFMGKSLIKATKEELLEISLDFHEVLMKMYAHQIQMENPQIVLSKKGKELRCINAN